LFIGYSLESDVIVSQKRKFFFNKEVVFYKNRKVEGYASFVYWLSLF